MRGDHYRLSLLAVVVPLLLLSGPAWAANIDLTRHPVGYLALVIFFVAYGFVAFEKAIQLRKSKPVMLPFVNGLTSKVRAHRTRLRHFQMPPYRI